MSFLLAPVVSLEAAARDLGGTGGSIEKGSGWRKKEAAKLLGVEYHVNRIVQNRHNLTHYSRKSGYFFAD